MVKNLLSNAGDTRDAGLISGSRRSPGEGNGNPLQYSCLEDSMDRGAWWAAIHLMGCNPSGGLQKSWTQLKRLSKHACILFRTQGEQEGPIHPVLELKGSPGEHRTGRVKRFKYICIVETSVFAVVFSVTTGDTGV